MKMKRREAGPQSRNDWPLSLIFHAKVQNNADKGKLIITQIRESYFK